VFSRENLSPDVLTPGMIIHMTRQPGDQNYKYGTTHIGMVDNDEKGGLVFRSYTAGRGWRTESVNENFINRLPAQITATNPINPSSEGMVARASRAVGNLIGPKSAEAAGSPPQYVGPVEEGAPSAAQYLGPLEPQLSTAPEPTGLDYIVQKLRDYLPLEAQFTAGRIEVEARDRGLTVPEYKRQLTDTARTEVANIIMRYASARTLGLTDAIDKFVNGDIQKPQTDWGTFLGAGGELAGFIQSPMAIGRAITGTRFLPTSQGLRGMAEIMTHGAATLGAASAVSSVLPSFLNSDEWTERTLGVLKSAGTGALVGAAFPLTGLVPSKPLQMVVGVAAMDMLRGKMTGNKGLFTLDDLYQGLQDGTIDRKELAQQAFDLLMDVYFIAKTPSMKAQLAEVAKRNPVAAELAKVNPEEAEQAILEVTGQRTIPKPEPVTGSKTTEPPAIDAKPLQPDEVRSWLNERQTEPAALFDAAHDMRAERDLVTSLELSVTPPETPKVEMGAETRVVPETPALKGEVKLTKMYGGGPETGPAIEKAVGAVVEDTAKIIREAPDQVRNLFEKIKDTSAKVWEWYQSPIDVKKAGFKRVIKRYLGDQQVAGHANDQFLQYVAEAVPNLAKRHGITAWIQAGGDRALLEHWAANSKWQHKPGYEAALNLAPAEIAIAKEVSAKFDEHLKMAQKTGVLKNFVENYVTQLWKNKKHNTQELQNLWAEANAGMLDTDFDYAKKRTISNYFEGEQAGRTPLNKDIAYILGAYHQAMYEAVSARKAVWDLVFNNADDGLPLISPRAGAGLSPDQSVPTGKYLVLQPPGMASEAADGRPYRIIDHPSLRDWRWRGHDEVTGKDAIFQGDVWVHPDIYKDMKNLLGRSALRENVLGRAALYMSMNLKSVLLSGLPTPFHQVHLGSHAIFHKLNPVDTPPIDFKDPVQVKAVQNGLMIYNHNALADFSEGLASSGTWATKIPGIGRVNQAYGEYLFRDLIPRLKMALYKEAFKRNAERYPEKSEDFIAEITANQSNAAFGELNYKAMGRSSTTQDIYRLLSLAPDFLEARLRFAGQALRPYGAEQRAALIRAVVGMQAGAMVFNMLFSDDHKTHWNEPFSLVIGDTQYSLRSVPGDIYHLLSDPRSFAYHRINPVTAKPVVEFFSGRNFWGRQQDFLEWAKSFGAGVAPIPTQPFVNKWLGSTTGEVNLVDSVLRLIGVTARKYKDPADKLLQDYFASHGRDLPAEERRERDHAKKMDKLVEDYLNTPTPEGKESIRGFIQALPEQDHERMIKRVDILRQFHGAPDRKFFMQLRGVQDPEIRAKAFLMKYDNADDAGKTRLKQELQQLPGINTDRFRNEIRRIRQGATQ
jgi:hypothetical protein